MDFITKVIIGAATITALASNTVLAWHGTLDGAQFLGAESATFAACVAALGLHQTLTNKAMRDHAQVQSHRDRP